MKWVRAAEGSVAIILLSLTLSIHAFAEESIVRVRVLKNKITTQVSGHGLTWSGRVRAPHESLLPKKEKITVVKESNGWHILFPEGHTELVSEEVLLLRGSEIVLDNHRVPDVLYFVPRDKKFDVVSELNLELYLKGVLPSEMPVGWPMEALKAQAVAARTFAMAVRESRVGEHFHLDSTVDHQVFQWGEYVQVHPSAKQKIDEAVDSTRGTYLQNEKGSPYWTYFHSHCGGHTEEPGNVWKNGMVNGVVADSGCSRDGASSSNDRGEWSYTLKGSELQKLLTSVNEGAPRKLIAVKMRGPNENGRVEGLEFIFSGDEKDSEMKRYFVSGQDLRKTVGFNKIKSTNFEFDFSDEGIFFKGRGYGHGAGLCQNGARLMALSKAKFTQILTRYYPNAKLSAPQSITDIR